MKLILTVGVSASGKSTWAKEQAKKTGALIACRDDLRFALTGANGWQEYEFRPEHEEIVTALQKSIFYRGKDKSMDVIIADTNLRAKTRDAWLTHAIQLHIPYEIVEFAIPLEEALERDAKRGIYSVGEEIIKKQWVQWQGYMRNKNG